MERRLAAILATDVVGYTRLMDEDEAGTLTALKAHREEFIDPTIAKHKGRIVKLMGDGALMEFASVVDAVSCAAELQSGMAERNADVSENLRITFRMGINLGDVIIEGDDLYGDGVNVAARLEGLVEPGSICLSSKVYDEVRKKLNLSFEDLGSQKLKNVAEPVRVYRIAVDKPVISPTSLATEALPLPDKPSIAVLPFANLSGDQEQEYFADGITEDIITEISRIAGILVISRNSTFTYKGKATKAQDVCRDLGVRYVMEGSVRKAGQRVRITAQLIDGRSGGHLWAERYDRELADIFAVQDDVTEKIVHALEINLADKVGGWPARIETDKPEAYDCVLRGREQYRLFSKDGNLRARQLYERAIELDPNYAAAYAGLALTCLHDWFLGSPDALDRAYELALTAEALDPSLPLAYEALGNVRLFKKQHEEAVAAARQWVKIEPGNADAYANLAGALHFSGEHEQVIPLIEKAMRLNPFYPFYYILYRGQAYLAMERYEEALEALKRSSAHNPESLPAHLYLAACFGLLGKDASARETMAEVHRINPNFSTAWMQTFLSYKRAADLDRLVEGLRKAGLFD